jgi:adenine-specific DNA-methyltransferase
MNDKTAEYQKERLNTLKQRLKQTLSDLFQIDSPDLDFGVYRIMNQKRDEITRFMDKDLIEAVDEEFGKYDDVVRDDIIKERAVLERRIREEIAEDALTTSGIKATYLNSKLARDLNERWLDLRKKEEVASMSDVQKAEIFAHLEEFFSRYYKDGDFLSLRRYSANEKYAVPYNGEEVLLHWANKDQYYIKTDRFLKGHGFDVGDYRVMFEVVRAEGQTDIKGNKRYFVLSGGEDEVTFDETKKLLTVRFAQIPLSDDELKDRFPPGGSRQKPNTDDIVDGLVAAIVAHRCIPKGLKDAFEAKERDTDVNPRLRKHVLGFTKESTSDFFIHKDLGGFLRQELDFYIKNEVFKLDDLGTKDEVPVERYVKRAKVLKSIANRIIDFLAQLEDFQKTLWEKKKFVLQTDYCMTIDHVPEKYYPAICANERQVQEWKNLYGIGEGAQQTISGDTIDVAFMKSHSYLVLDTAFFDAAFKDHLLEDLQHPDGTPVEDLDEATGGLMIKSENWQALNLLQERYKEQVKCIYIDPPYNTGNDEFIYRDNYQHSSWLSMVYDRVALGRNVLNSEGVFFSSIDDTEAFRYQQLLQTIYGQENFLIGLVWEKRYSPPPDTKDFGYIHELIHTFRKSPAFNRNLLPLTEEQAGRYKNPDNDPRGPWKPMDYTCRYTSEERPNLYYPIVNPVTQEEIWPQRSRVWAFSKDVHQQNMEEEKIWWGIHGQNKVPALKNFLSTIQQGKMPTSILPYSDVGHTDEAAKELRSFFPSVKMTPKPTRLIQHLMLIGADKNSKILDYYAGSGTTAHAVLTLNKEDGGNRKYILVEMGDYFDTVTKPRIEKVAYSSNWKDGKPLDTDGQSHIFKYMILEQYEDTLDNIEFLGKDGRVQQTLFSVRDYMLHYFLNFETKESPCRLNVDSMATPFAYTLKVRRDSGFDQFPADKDGFREVTVDLVETFNYLLGLHVIRRITREHNGLTYRIVHGTAPDNRKVTVVWRNSPKKPEDHRVELEEDAAFITEKILAEFPDTATLYVNGHCFAPRAVPLEPEFKKRMGA